MDVPDFTKGEWRNQKPFGIETVDLSKLNGLDVDTVKKDKTALNV
jgi:hypothetical protein